MFVLPGIPRLCRQQAGIAAGGEFIVRPVRNCCPIENIKMKLTTKSQIEIRQPEQKYSDANSRSLNVQPHLQQAPMLAAVFLEDLPLF